MTHLRELFMLDPEVIYLNHGSFGATPRPVFEAYQEWQRRLERQPVLFLARELDGLLAEAREALGNTLGARAEDLVYVPNATFGVNVVARSLELGPGDEVLSTDHEYGACDLAWQFLCRKSGAGYVKQEIPLPAGSAEAILEQFWAGVTPRTQLIFLSHISSPTALCFPVEAICRRAREAGILTLIDGAHAPGQIPLDLDAIGADFYTGNCHKWLLSPKGAAFLHTRPDRQALVEPLVASWGAEGDYQDRLEWTGTRDPAAYLSVPAAIQFQVDHDWPAVRQRCHQLLRQAMAQVGRLTGLAPLYAENAGLYHQMATLPLPPKTDLPALKARLYDEYRIEVPEIEWNGRPFIRVSIQGYNRAADVEALVEALAAVLPLVVASL